MRLNYLFIFTFTTLLLLAIPGKAKGEQFTYIKSGQETKQLGNLCKKLDHPKPDQISLKKEEKDILWICYSGSRPIDAYPELEWSRDEYIKRCKEDRAKLVEHYLYKAEFYRDLESRSYLHDLDYLKKSIQIKNRPAVK